MRNIFIAVILLFQFCFANVARAQVGKLEGKTCDDWVRASDFNLFTGQPVFPNNRGKMLFCIRESKVLAIYTGLKQRRRVEAGKLAPPYSASYFGQAKLYWKVDSISGAHRYKPLFDSILVADSFILHKRSMFANVAGQYCSDMAFYCIQNGSLYGGKLDCDFSRTAISELLNSGKDVGQYLSQLYKRTFGGEVKVYKLEKNGDMWYFGKKSLFSLSQNFYLDLYLHDLDSDVRK
jgi:hypothetical protein